MATNDSPSKSRPVIPLTTEKAKNAVAALSSELKLKDLPALGDASVRKLTEAGVTTYWLLFSKFLELEPEAFRSWLDDVLPPMKSDLKDELVDVLKAKKNRYEDV